MTANVYIYNEDVATVTGSLLRSFKITSNSYYFKLHHQDKVIVLSMAIYINRVGAVQKVFAMLIYIHTYMMRRNHST